MPECKPIRQPHRKICIGDLNKRITLHDRSIEAPAFGDVDFNLDFAPMAMVYCMVKTVGGKTFFDGAGTEFSLTHEIIIRFREDVTTETWVELPDTTLIDVIDIENLEERNEWLKLRCVERGKKDQEAAQA